MDGGPFRTPQPTDRKVVNRPEPLYRSPEEPQSPARATESRHGERKSSLWKKVLLSVLIVVVVAAAGVGGWFVWSKSQTPAASLIDTSKYQAVFFTNGQVYFGKLQVSNGDYLKLTDIYYLQTQTTTGSENPQETSTDQNNVQLIKLGDEIHGPEDAMIIAKDQLLFYENLKPDGKVALSIEKFKKQ